MVKIITGNKGSGKTKVLVDMINKAAGSSSGSVICVEKGMNLTYDISHKARLIVSDEYGIDCYDTCYGFIAGILSGNYDITDVFVDGILKIGGRNYDELAKFLDKLNALSGENIAVTITVSEDTNKLPDSVTKYMM